MRSGSKTGRMAGRLLLCRRAEVHGLSPWHGSADHESSCRAEDGAAEVQGAQLVLGHDYAPQVHGCSRGRHACVPSHRSHLHGLRDAGGSHVGRGGGPRRLPEAAPRHVLTLPPGALDETEPRVLRFRPGKPAAATHDRASTGRRGRRAGGGADARRLRHRDRARPGDAEGQVLANRAHGVQLPTGRGHDRLRRAGRKHRNGARW
mmetsp:Transcript_1541/g.3636  ORF Transcript_1541/g.3636 Transcript_1541/m.3636 type:complete len:205 (+) Transcript_1541:734-1348(+)